MPVPGQIMTQDTNTILVSKDLIGQVVYAPDNVKIGSISELILSKDGKSVQGFVIGVGGFLGIGESNVAVNFDQLKFVNEPMRTSSATTTPSTGATGSSTSGTVGTTATTTTATTPSKPSINPDHAKLSMTKEQLQALPQFKFAN
jgi:sporulation protein YlmC with PRC-barrel domain